MTPLTPVVFAVAVLGAPFAFGLPLTRLPSVRGLALPARISIGWAGGTILLAGLLTLFSAVNIAWRPWVVVIIAAIAVVVAVRMKAPRDQETPIPRSVDRTGVLAVVLGGVIAWAGLIRFASGAATSADLSYFWGVKAVRFAIAHGLDFEWMQLPHLIHLHPNYPPLWPVSLAWGALVSGSLPWTLVPVLTWVYLVATAAIVHSLLRRALGKRSSMIVTCLWLATLTGSAARSFSGGSAEGPLVLFVTVAVGAVVTEGPCREPTLRWLAAGALAGAVLTKSEGAVAAGLVVAGVAIRDGLWRKPGFVRSTTKLALPAFAAAGLWFVVRVSHGVPLTDPIRETAFVLDVAHLEDILKVCARLLVPGVLWIGWLAPLIAAATSRPVQPVRALPGLMVVAGLPAFAFVYYLHVVGDPVELIVWTFPRLIQPALSAWIVSLAVLCFARPTAGPEVTS